MTDHRELAGRRRTAMDVAVAAAHRAGARTEISAGDIDERFAESGAASLIADQGRENIPLLKKRAPRHADGFLAFAEVNPAGDHAAAIKAGEFLLENARLEHDAECFEI